MRRAALYLRVSTNNGQTTENQRRELETAAQRNGWEVVAVFEDQGVSAAKDRRPALDRMMKGVARREFDLVAAWSVDRIGRSLKHLVLFAEELKSKAIDMYFHVQAVDTSTPAGKAMFGMMSVFAEFERSMVCDRIAAGLARARVRGARLGRPRIDAATERKAAAMIANGAAVRATARACRIGMGTAQRIKEATR